jgi:parallel beta-helix repeat protein
MAETGAGALDGKSVEEIAGIVGGEPFLADGAEPERQPPWKGKEALIAAGAAVGAIALVAAAYLLFFAGDAPPAAHAGAEGCTFPAGIYCDSFSLANGSNLLELTVTQVTGNALEIYAVSCGPAGQLDMQPLGEAALAENGSSVQLSGGASGNALTCDGNSGARFERSICIHYTVLGENAQGEVCGTLRGAFLAAPPTPEPTPSPPAGNGCSGDCPIGRQCASDSDCASRYCSPVSGACEACPGNCAQGAPCYSDAQCASGFCSAGACTCAFACENGAPCRKNSACAGGVCSLGTCRSATPNDLYSCSSILDPGSYTVQKSINASDTCFVVSADDVSIDCGGNKIAGNNVGVAFDVAARNVTITNCAVEWFEKGVEVERVADGFSLSDSAFLRNTIAAVEVNGRNAVVERCVFEDNGPGIVLLENSNGSKLFGNVVAGSKGVGIDVQFPASGGSVAAVSNTVTGSLDAGMVFRNSQGSLVYANNASQNSGHGMIFSTGCSGNNISGNTAALNRQSGISLGSGGNWLEGNTAALNGVDGISVSGGSNAAKENVGCNNRNNDVSCSFGGSVSDSGGNACTANSCGSLSCTPCPFITSCAAISAPGRYELSADISANGGCITVTASGVTLDCNGAVLHGSGVGSGIEVTGARDVIVRNCSVEGFYNGFRATGAEVLLEGCTAARNTGDGLAAENCSRVDANNSFFLENGRNGFSVSGAGNSTVSASVARNNSVDGFNFDGGYRTLLGCEAAQNGGRGIFMGSASGFLADNTACGNKAPSQLYCDAKIQGMDGRGNACRPVHRCDVNCAECPS